MNVESFIAELASIRLNPVFNPYVDQCSLLDQPDAPTIRRANLAAYLHFAKGRTSTIWIARDLGYRGGRRTGLALTDECHLEAFSARYGGISVARATKGPPVAERTAGVIWRMILCLPKPPFLWNVFPFHPHEPNDPLSNRCHTLAERRRCEPLMTALLDWLRPEAIIAIGNDAYRALTALGYPCAYVRHPSYGGQAGFVTGIATLYRLESDESARIPGL